MSDELVSKSQAIEALESFKAFRDSIGAWLCTTNEDVCPVCGRDPNSHEAECWIEQTLRAWDRLHEFVEPSDTPCICSRCGLQHAENSTVAALPVVSSPVTLTREKLESLMWQVQGASYRDTKEAEIGLGYALQAMRELIRLILNSASPTLRECPTNHGCDKTEFGWIGDHTFIGGVVHPFKFCPDCGVSLTESYNATTKQKEGSHENTADNPKTDVG